MIASGDCSSNPEMSDKYINSWASRLTLCSFRNTSGENITLTLPVFSKMVNMVQFYAGAIVSETHLNPADILNTMQGTIGGTKGKRYMGEQE